MLQVSLDENSKPSVVHESKLQNRKAFFDAVAQPVRIDARLFLGLDPGFEKKTSPDESTCVKVDDDNTETKKPSEGTKEEGRQGLNDVVRVNHGSGQEMTSERHRKQKKKKKQPKGGRRKLKKTKKWSDRRKAEGAVPCTTAVASASVVATCQTVALVPLSEEETSSDEEATRQGGKEAGRMMDADSAGSDSVEVFAGGSREGIDSILCASSNSEQDERVTELSVEHAGNRYLPVDCDGNKEELSDSALSGREGKGPRPGLLSAEAMFSSYEEAVVATTSYQQESSENTGDDEDSADPELSEEVFLVKNNGNVEPIKKDTVIISEHCNTEQNLKNRSTEAGGSMDEVLHDENAQASCQDSFNRHQIDSGYMVEFHVPQEGSDLSCSVNSGDVGQKHGSGFDVIGNDEDGKLARIKENLAPSAESGVEYEDEEIGTIVEEFPGFEYSGGTVGNVLLKERAAKTEVESFSEDDKAETMCSDLSKKQIAQQHTVNNSTQVIKGMENELRHSDVSQESDVFSAVAGVDGETDFQFIDQECGLVSVDPLSCLDCLLRSLSSSKDNIDKPLSDTLLSNEPPVVASGLEESNICSKQELTTLFEQQPCEAMAIGVSADLEGKEEEEETDIDIFVTLERPNKPAVIEDQCTVDENINYISPSSVTEATLKDKGQLGSSLPISSASLNCDRCSCMKDKDSGEAEKQLRIDESSLLVEKEQHASGAKDLAKRNNQTSNIITLGEMGTIDSTGLQVPTDRSKMLHTQENVVNSNETMEMFDLVNKTKINEAVNKTLEMKESKGLVAQKESMITDDALSQMMSGKVTEDLSETSAANSLQSFVSDAQLTVATTKELNVVRNIGCSTNIPTSATPRSILDAKRMFFQQVSQPVRISPHVIFKDDFPLKECSSTNQLQTEVTTGGQLLNSEASLDAGGTVIAQREQKEEQTEDDALARREEKTKRRLLPEIPTDQVPLDVSLETVRAISEVVNSPQIIRPTGGSNVLSLSEEEIRKRGTEQSNRRLLPSCDAFSHLKSFDPPTKGTSVVLERHGSVPIQRISLPSGNEGTASGSSPGSCGNGQEDVIKDGKKGLTLTDQTYSGITSAPTAIAENLKSKDCRGGTRSASLGTEINNLCIIEKTGSLHGNIGERKITEHNLTKHQKQLNNSLPELSKRTHEYHIDLKTTSEMHPQEH